MSADYFLSLVAAIGALALSNATLSEAASDTAKKPVTNEYQGVTVEDQYQWLENDDDPQVKAWSDAQSQRTRKYLNSLPDRAAIEARLKEWYAKTSPSYFSLVARPEILFAMKFQPPKQQPLLVTLTSADDLKSEKIVLDPNVLDSKGTTAIDWFVPSLDGRYIAVSLSKGGSEDGTREEILAAIRDEPSECTLRFIPQQGKGKVDVVWIGFVVALPVQRAANSRSALRSRSISSAVL